MIGTRQSPAGYAFPRTNTWEDALVDGSGRVYPRGTRVFRTLAAAEASLPSTGGTVVVKSGTYAGATLAKGPSLWILEPGVVLTSGITTSGNKIAIDGGELCPRIARLWPLLGGITHQ